MSYGNMVEWRDSARTPKLFTIDARAFIPILITFFYFTTEMFVVDVAVIVAFMYMEKKGYSLKIQLTILRELIFGKKKILKRSKHSIYS